MTDTAEMVKVYRQLEIASYALTVPTLALWICLLIRMLILRDREKFSALIVICILMILSLIGSIVSW